MAVSNTHLEMLVPSEWSSDDKGKFFESIIADLLRPMRYEVTHRIRSTGMEIDLLAKHKDSPKRALVECKATRDPVAAEVISKLMGNIALEKADAGWLFTTAELTKDGKGLWEKIQKDPELAGKFTWYSPATIISVLLDSSRIVDTASLPSSPQPYVSGDWTLVITLDKWIWLQQLLSDGVPRAAVLYNAATGELLPDEDAGTVVKHLPRFSALILEQSQVSTTTKTPKTLVQSVARLIPGDSWDDLRPARPSDFVGRDELRSEIVSFIETVQTASTPTRTFAVQGPSGWGKSSLILKLADSMHASGSISVTAIDSRSATSSTFVSEALRIAFQDAINAGLVSADMAFDIRNLHDPISAPDYVRAIGELQDGNACIVLVFDQFEELFSKEDLFDAFSAIRELCLTVDALQIPVILGFSWKTDISLPQEHPAYHLWHELTDRRKSFKIREFRDSDVKRIITKAEHSSGKRLSPALRARLIEQCQGLPWLLKKLLVHVLQRVSTPESQFHLLERELDIELLFKEDLAQLSDEAVKCLTYVAEHAPVPVPDVEINFARETTNFLINLHLLVRSGMNYVVYWDIFRDYLVEGRIPTIPWSKMFQRDPTVPVRALSTLKSKGALSIHNLAEEIRLRDRPCMNVVGDLVALQLVESDGSGNYSVVGHLESTDPVTIAGYVQRQLKRHVIVQAMDELWPREVQFDHDAWVDFFVRVHPRAAEFSAGTVRQYANTFRRWLIFAGLLEQHDHWLRRSTGSGRQIGILASARASPGTFLGVAAPDAVVRVVEMVRGHGGRMKRGALDAAGLRNATTDAVALGLVIGTDEAGVELVYPFVDRAEIHSRIRDAVVRQRTFQLIAAHDPLARGLDGELGTSLQALVGTKWKPASVKRYLGGLRQYLRWLNELKEGIRSGASE